MEEHSPLAVLRALSNPARLNVACCLVVTPTGLVPRDVQALTALAQPTVSHHLAILVTAGVLVEIAEGTSRRYLLNQRLLRRLGIDLRKLREATRPRDMTSLQPMVRRVRAR